MPLDFRYHLASLAAVFGALVIGILLGVAMKEGPVLSTQIQNLNVEFKRSEALKEVDQKNELFNKRTEILLVRNRLMWRNIALVGNPSPSVEENMDAMRATLEEAGATVTTQIVIKPALLTLTPQQVQPYYDKLGLTVPDESGLDSDLMTRLASEIGSSATPILQAMTKAKCLHVTGDPNKTVTTLIYLGGVTETDNYLTDVDLPFLRACSQRNFVVVGTEPLGVAPFSAMGEYQKILPFTVDNIDHVAGRVALVLALSNGQKGNYGYKHTADEVVPVSD